MRNSFTLCGCAALWAAMSIGPSAAQAPVLQLEALPSEQVRFGNDELLPRAGEAVGGLKLVVAAERDRLVLRPGTEGAPAAEATKITIAFENAGNRPIKLDTYLLTLRCIRVRVAGPGADSVRRTVQHLDFMVVAPQEGDYPVLAPGKRWVYPHAVTFPGTLDHRTTYAFVKAGVYEVQLVYARPAGGGASPWEEGAWEGSVVGNTLRLTVSPPAAP